MSGKYKNVLIILIGFILWILYLCDTEMSRYGIYTIFSYNTHEIMSALPLLIILITLVWLITLLSVMVREKNVKTHILLVIVLFVLFIGQSMYIINRYQTMNTTFITSIDRINNDKMEVVINTDGHGLTLECPMIVLGILKTDGTEYIITYEWNRKNPNRGKLCMVQSID